MQFLLDVIINTTKVLLPPGIDELSRRHSGKKLPR
jgi:hypothetical protein